MIITLYQICLNFFATSVSSWFAGQALSSVDLSLSLLALGCQRKNYTSTHENRSIPKFVDRNLKEALGVASQSHHTLTGSSLACSSKWLFHIFYRNLSLLHPSLHNTFICIHNSHSSQCILESNYTDIRRLPLFMESHHLCLFHCFCGPSVPALSEVTSLSVSWILFISLAQRTCSCHSASCVPSSISPELLPWTDQLILKPASCWTLGHFSPQPLLLLFKFFYLFPFTARLP